MAELLVTLHGSGLEPKRVRFVHPRVSQPPNLVLVESVRGARPGVVVEAPLLLANEDGSPGAELNDIYRELGTLAGVTDNGGI